MMTVDHVLALVQETGIQLEAHGEVLRVMAPPGTLSPELRDALTRFKREILARLQVPRFVTLPEGPSVPLDALRVAIDFEGRGFRLGVDPDGQFTIEPTCTSGALTIGDRQAVQRWRYHLGAIVAFASRAALH